MSIRIAVLGAVVWATAAFSAEELSGVVGDASGASIRGAKVQIVTAGGATLATMRTSVDGTFRWNPIENRPFVLRVSADGFSTREVPLTAVPAQSVEIQLAPESLSSSVTVIAGGCGPYAFKEIPYASVVNRLG